MALGFQLVFYRLLLDVGLIEAFIEVLFISLLDGHGDFRLIRFVLGFR